MVAFASHINWILENKGQDLVIACTQDGYRLSALKIVETMVKTDPTDKKQCVDWMCSTYLAKGWRWEDISGDKDSKVAGTLNLFLKYRQNLRGTARNLSQYGTLAQVYKVIQPYHEQEEANISKISGKETKRREQKECYEQSKIIFRSDNLTIAVPLTEQAAKWWGRGTQWCTAAERNNAFQYYNEKAPLIVILLNDRKLQLYLGETETQFMDETDSDVKEEFIQEHWQELGGLLRWAVNKDPKLVGFFPYKERTEELLVRLIKKNSLCASKIPLALCTEDFYLRILEDSNLAANYNLIPQEFRTVKVNEKIVAKNYKYISHMPIQQVTENIVVSAALHSPIIAKFFSDRLTKEGYIRILERNPKVLEYFPKEYQTYQLCLKAVEDDGWVLPHVLPVYQTEELCLAALKQTADAFRFFPQAMQTADMCKIAVNMGCDPKNIPNHLLTNELISKAIEKNGSHICYLDDKWKTLGNCLLALESYCWAWPQIPRLIEKEIVRHPDKRMINSLVTRSVQQDGRCLQYIPVELLTPEICQIAVENYASMLEHVPRKYQTPEMYMQAVQKNCLNLRFVPRKHKTLELCRIAWVKRNMDISLIPKEVIAVLASENNQKWSMDSLTDLQESLENHLLDKEVEVDQTLSFATPM